MRYHLITMLLACSIASAQTGIITGTVRDANTGEPLIGANVLIVGTNQGAATNVNGRYTIRNVPAGKIKLSATYIGYYRDTRDSLYLRGYDSLLVDFKLKENVISTSEMCISTSKPMVDRQATNNRSVLSQGVLENLPVQGVQAVVSTLAGKISTSNNPNFRGARSDQTQFVVHGMDASEPTSMTVQPMYYNPSAEEYERYEESSLTDALKQPLSTFSIDVDKASYANVRRFLTMGKMPPKDAVRVEEMLNYFSYEYPQPEDGKPFTIYTEYGVCPWNPDRRIAMVALQGETLDMIEVPPSNLVFLLDVSGSMREENKLPLLQKSFRFLVEQLRPQDVVSIVVYAGAAGVVLEPTAGSEKEKILAAIDRLHAGGSTAGGEGIMRAYDLAEENFIEGGNNRIILATDGDFNVGVSNTDALVDLVAEKRKTGVYISILGFGMGNLKDEKLEKLADKGNGMYAYVDSYMEAQRIFGGQLAGTLFTIAKDVKLQIEFNPARVHFYRLIGYDNRRLRDEDFRNDTVDAGDMGAGHCVTALYEIVPVSEYATASERAGYKYSEWKVKSSAERSNELFTVHVRYKDPVTDAATESAVSLVNTVRPPSENFRFATAVAEFGLMLKDSPNKGEADYGRSETRARSAYGMDTDGRRHELVSLIAAAAAIK